MDAQPPVVAEVVRGGLVESRHRGHVAAVGADGSTPLTLGDTAAPMFPRSAVKHVQAVGMLRAGLDLPPDLLALVAGSHSGSDDHARGVRTILASVGLTEAALRCPESLPLDPARSDEHVRAGGKAERLLMNCSGKHAGMLATCVTAGWSTDGYLDPGHPLQRTIHDTIAELADERPAVTTVDGCGAPLFAFSLAGLARAIGRVSGAGQGSEEGRVARASRAFPVMVGGHGRADTTLMTAVPGLVAKEGAEGVLVAGSGDGTGVAVKIEDGAKRATVPVLVAALVRLGVLGAEAAERPPVAALARPAVRGGGRPVGEIRTLL